MVHPSPAFVETADLTPVVAAVAAVEVTDDLRYCLESWGKCAAGMLIVKVRETFVLFFFYLKIKWLCIKEKV
jgi:hypothetical protein